LKEFKNIDIECGFIKEEFSEDAYTPISSFMVLCKKEANRQETSSLLIQEKAEPG